MLKPRPIIVAAIITGLAAGGGMTLYTSQWVLAVFLWLTMLALPLGAYCFFYLRARPAGLYPLAALLAAGLVSGLANLDTANIWLGRLYLAAAAAWLLPAAAAWLSNQDITAGLRLAGMVSPFLLAAAWLLGWRDHQNILAFYPAVFVVAGLTGRRKWPVVINALLLLYFASRGAVIAATVGAAALLWPYWRRYWPAYIALAVVGLAALSAWRYPTVIIRLHYWQAALLAWTTAPWLGLGPLGLWANKIYPEGGWYLIHAHNTIITTLAETGLIGLLALLTAAGSLLTTMRCTRLQAAIAVGLAAWSMVDEPLFWAGPMLTTALIFSTLQTCTPRRA